MRRGFTFIEFMICVAIIMIIASIAVPNILESKKRQDKNIHPGDTVEIRLTGISHAYTGVVVDTTPASGFVRVRLDNGPNAAPRFSELMFKYDELTKVVQAEQPQTH